MRLVEMRPEGKSGSGVLGMGQGAPPHQLGGLSEHCKFPNGVEAEPRKI